MDDSALVEQVARLLADGRIIGWYEGRSEFGPRALGRRSILADPRRADMKDTLNRRVKHREPFRPFAPVVLAHRASEVFELTGERRFMLWVDPVQPDWRARIPAVVHADGTARVQTLTQEDHPRLFALLAAFERLTGVPLLVNTSLNVAGEPLVERPGEALAILRRGELDALVLGDHLATATRLDLCDASFAAYVPRWRPGCMLLSQLVPGGARPLSIHTAGGRRHEGMVFEPPDELIRRIDGRRTVAEVLSADLALEPPLRELVRLGMVRLEQA
jgi:hypothetical protein